MGRTLNRMAAAAAVVLAAAVAPAPAQAQHMVLFEWSGRVDSLARLSMHGDQANATVIGVAGEHGPGKFTLHNVLPREEGHVAVQLAQGHADVEVVQQPNASNDYTAVVRLRDYSGPERVWLSASWDPARTYQSGGDVDRDRSDRDADRDADRDRGNAGLLHWTGDVDNTVVIRWRGDHTMLENITGDSPRDVRADVAGAGLPHRDATIRIVKHQGKGDIDIVQQPTAANDYTAVIRVRDKDEGYHHYDFDVVVDRQ